MGNKNKGGISEATKQAKNFKEITDDAKDYSSLQIVFFYCSLIVFLPVITFFCLKDLLLQRLFVLTEVTSNIYSAMGAVIALHFALGLYIYRAYFVSSSTSRKKGD